MKSATLFRFAIAAALAGLASSPTGVFAFTQHAGTAVSNVIPLGHEWITRMSAIELLDPNSNTDAADPRKAWPGNQGKAKNLDLGSAASEVNRIKAGTTDENTYASRYQLVWAAIIGERWVDIGGNNYSKSSTVYKYNCLDLVTQEPAEVQYDHYMRRYDDVGARGGLNAARASSDRFVKYFVAAAMAAPGTMEVWDGGAYSALTKVDRNYFLLGRALHLFQDSFSADHTVRVDQDRFEKVRQVKSYLCAEGSEQHAHGTPTYDEGDVIWKPSSQWASPSWSSYIPSNMKDLALVAAEGSKDVWAAFIRTMAVPQNMRAATAQREAEAVAAQWLAVNDEQETLGWYRDQAHRGATYVKSPSAEDDGGNGQTQAQCMARDWSGVTQAQKVKEFEDGQRICVYNMVPANRNTEVDPSLHLPYNWTWRSSLFFKDPPANWKVGD